MFNVKASPGALLSHEGIQLFVPPHSFDVFDIFDTNLACSSGMDIVINVELYPGQLTTNVLPRIDTRAESYIGPMVRLSPTAIDPFKIPLTLRMPHHASSSSSSSTTAACLSNVVVVELIMPTDHDLDMGHERFYRDVPSDRYRYTLNVCVYRHQNGRHRRLRLLCLHGITRHTHTSLLSLTLFSLVRGIGSLNDILISI